MGVRPPEWRSGAGPSTRLLAIVMATLAWTRPARADDGIVLVHDAARPLVSPSLVDAVAENRFKVKVDAINETLLMEGLQKIANRITVGLMISAMIVGAALLMRIQTSFTIFGYPGIAILFFLAAGFSAMALVFNISLHDMRAAKHKLRAKEKVKNRDPGAEKS